MAYDLPEAFIREAAERLGDELPAFLRAYGEPPLRGIRLNPLKPAAARPRGLGAAVAWARDGFELSADSDAGAVPLHEAGAWYLQEPSAMLPAAVLSPRPGERVLDLCAAPGGKSTQLAAMLQGKGLLVCNEPVAKRAQILSRNLERMGVANSLAVCAMPDALAERWPGGFDAVLADAPCSGEGMFRRHPETCGEWTPESPAGCAARQAQILDAAARLVRRGGRLVYSTCTFSRAENEETVAAFLDRHGDFSLQPFALPGISAPEGVFTCWPHRLRGEGQFAALLVRAGDEKASMRPDRSLGRPGKDQLAAWRSFQPDSPLEPTAVLGDTLVCLPDCPDVRGLKVLRCGLHLGQARGKLFQPDHALALAAEGPAVPRLPVTEEEAARWQAGEALPVPDELRGWVLPALDGLALGWGKASGGQLKNHYPKGLRRPFYR